VFLALAPEAGARRIARRPRCVLVSGTNGKTTTTALIASALGDGVAVNATGANLLSGIYSALVARPDATSAVLEVDEAALPSAVRALEPTVVALLNLSRDQLDRMQEVRRLATRWRDALTSFAGTVVANADDPLVVWAIRESHDVRWVAAGQPWVADSSTCAACGAILEIEPDDWRCPRCSLRRPATGPTSDVPATGLPGRCNQANALVAAAVLEELGVPLAPDAWSGIDSVGGRYERRSVGGRDVRLLLAKNPAGWAETLQLLDRGAPVVLALNARREDGTDPSWIWDVPFEDLRGTPVTCTGERASDLAVRLHYADVEFGVAPDILTAVRRHPAGRVDVAANYSAFRSARIQLARA
jgi:UDP-N-acetylmuramyl tripeptide synthase